MKNRSRLDIIVAILDTAMNGASRTKIVYSAYLSNAQLKEYLSILIANGLLEENVAEKLYKLTEKGTKFMTIYQHMGELTGPLQKS